MLIIGKRASHIIQYFLNHYHTNKKWIIPLNVCTLLVDTLNSVNVPFDTVDIDEDTLCIDENEVVEKLKRNKDKYEGLLFVHSYGWLQDCTSFYKEIKEIKENIMIFDDRSLCIPALEKPEKNNSDLVLYSTGRGKYIDFTMGGYAWCEERFSAMKNIPVSFDSGRYLNLIIERLPRRKNQAKRIKNIYKNGLSSDIQYPEKFQDWRFNIRVKNKDEIMNELKENCLIANSEYAPLKQYEGDITKTKAMKVYNSMINLFHDFRISEAMANKIVEVVNPKSSIHLPY